MLVNVCTITTDDGKRTYKTLDKCAEWMEYCKERFAESPSSETYGLDNLTFDCGYIDAKGMYHEPPIHKGIHDTGDYDTDAWCEYFLFVDFEGTPLYCATKTEEPQIYSFGGRFRPVPIKFFKYEFYTEDPSNMDDESEIDMVYTTENGGPLQFDMINTVDHGVDEDASAELVEQDLLFYRAYAFDEDDEQLMWGLLINVNNMEKYSFCYGATSAVPIDEELDITLTTGKGGKQFVFIKNRVDRDDSHKVIPRTVLDFETMQEINEGS